jgi:hypothetical protein
VREEEKNSLQANEIMQHQPRFNNNAHEQSAHQHTQGLHPKSPGMGDAGHMSQSTYELNINLLNTVMIFLCWCNVLR